MYLLSGRIIYLTARKTTKCLKEYSEYEKIF